MQQHKVPAASRRIWNMSAAFFVLQVTAYGVVRLTDGSHEAGLGVAALLLLAISLPAGLYALLGIDYNDAKSVTVFLVALAALFASAALMEFEGEWPFLFALGACVAAYRGAKRELRPGESNVLAFIAACPWGIGAVLGGLILLDEALRRSHNARVRTLRTVALAAIAALLVSGWVVAHYDAVAHVFVAMLPVIALGIYAFIILELDPDERSRREAFARPAGPGVTFP